MKYMMMVVCGLLALLAALACTRSYAFVAPLTNWPIVLTALAAITLMFVRKPWQIMSAGVALITASLLEFVGAFFSFIVLILALFGTPQVSVFNSFIDLFVLLMIGVFSFLTSWLALGWGVWHTIRSPRQVLHPFLHA